MADWGFLALVVVQSAICLIYGFTLGASFESMRHSNKTGKIS